MKIRECLVSNSSSSSFVIIGKELHSFPEKISDKKIYMTSDSFYGSEGEIVVKVTQEVADFIRENKEKFDENITLIFYDAFMELTNGLKIKSDISIPKGLEVFCFNRDQCSPEDLNTFKEMCENDNLLNDKLTN